MLLSDGVIPRYPMVSPGENRGLAIAGMETSSERVDSVPEVREIMHSPNPLSSLPHDSPRRFARALTSFRRRVLHHLGPKSEEFNIKFF